MKRVTITLDDEIEEWLNEQIKKSTFYNYQHTVEFCLKHLMENKYVLLSDDLTKEIDNLIKSGKIPYLNRQTFILECVQQQIA